MEWTQSPDQSSAAIARTPWWINPSRLVLFFVLPIYLLCGLLGQQTLFLQGVKDYITLGIICIGGLSLLCFAVGAWGGSRLPANGVGLQRIPAFLLDQVIVGFGGITIAAYLVFFAPILWNMELLAEFLRGSSSIRFRYIFNQLPGITSFVGLGNLCVALYAARMIFYTKRIPIGIHVLIIFMLLCVFLRAFLNSERLALIEVLFALAIPFVSFRHKSSVFRWLAPFIGLIFLFLMFSVFEYFRSWQFYKDRGDYGLAAYMIYRFLAYFTTSINNGAGMMEFFAPLGYPALSGAWFYKFPLWSQLGIKLPTGAPIEFFLEQYANPEFNNPGGMFVLLVDFGMFFGCLGMIVCGVIAGNLFKRFRRATLLGVILFPSWLAGVSDLFRVLYWSETRVFPIVAGSLVAVFWIRASLGKLRRSKGSLPDVSGAETSVARAHF